jgi:hypothetical protein
MHDQVIGPFFFEEQTINMNWTCWNCTQQHINIKFCAMLDKSVSETLQMLTEACGADAMKKSSVFEWHKRFKEGREDVKDDKRAGHPKTHRIDENVEKVRKLVHSDRRLSS